MRSTAEHVDGTGYPDRLRGDDIPVGSRIVAACHGYVTLVHGRESDPAAINQALAALGREVGTRFDAQVVDVLAGVVADPDAYVPLARTGSA